LARTLAGCGAFADLDGERLVVAATRVQLERALVQLAGAVAADSEAESALALGRELQRALEADRSPARTLRLRSATLDLGSGPKTMGILNVTPDSFFDGGRYRGLDAAVARAFALVEAGAELIDIGGRSYAATNPQIAAEEELARILPLVGELVRRKIGVPLSIDTTHAAVALATLAVGADLINDCSGLSEPELVRAVAREGGALVVMHLRGELNVRAAAYPYEDALGEIVGFLRERCEFALEHGVAPESLVVDPGLEFGKEPRTDLEILERFGDLRSLGYPILLAASRKSFLGRIMNLPASELLVPSLALAALGICAGAAMVRTHDVPETVRLCRMLATVRPANRARIPIAAAMPDNSTS
ncbi:MAG: dihydropteroate synthase, partial [Vulcanimicrobiaceae bacterium]